MKKRTHAGFTLVELIVVLAILAVLLVMIVPRVTGYVSDARETAARNNAAAVLHAAELYVVEQERDGATPAASITSGEGNVLADYLDNVSDNDHYQLSIVYDDASHGYAITGTYTSGAYTVAIPDMTVTHSDGAAESEEQEE